MARVLSTRTACFSPSADRARAPAPESSESTFPIPRKFWSVACQTAASSPRRRRRARHPAPDLLRRRRRPVATCSTFDRAISARRSPMPVRVNSQPGSAIATGTIRGGQLALGTRRPRARGLERLRPRAARAARSTRTLRSLAHRSCTHAPPPTAPLRAAAQPQRRTSTRSTAAARSPRTTAGHVYAVWHGNRRARRAARITARSGWRARWTMARRSQRQRPAWDTPTGACGCCQARALATAGERSGAAVSIGDQPHAPRHLRADLARRRPELRRLARAALVDQRLPDDQHVAGDSRRRAVGRLGNRRTGGTGRRRCQLERCSAIAGRTGRRRRAASIRGWPRPRRRSMLGLDREDRLGARRLDRLAGVRWHRPSVRADRIGPIASGLELRIGYRAP